jgi:transitional endoplasmic reticulum ATPase
VPNTSYAPNPDMITGDEILFREDDLQLFTLPRDMTYSRAMEIFEAKRREQETESVFRREFNYRPRDGAVATAIVLRSRYGLVMGKSIPTMFGDRPPEILDVPTGPGGRSTQAPWGRIQIPVIDGGSVYLDDTEHRDYGQIFELIVKAKRKFSREVEELFTDVAEQLRNGSIYRGQAVCGADELTFIEGLSRFDPGQIVFASDVQASLNAALFSPLQFPDAYRAEKIALKRAVLLHGPYGTGKTSVGLMIARIAVAGGWTFVMARPGRDAVEDVLATARLYAPAVVWVEDVDTDTGGATSPKAVSSMLDAFDGINSKHDGEIIVAMSTNHIDRVPPGMLRPGRLDYVIEIGALDRPGAERLIRVAVAEGKLAADVDFDAVYAQMTGFLPAFVRATADRARSHAIHRTGGRNDYVLTTEDLVNAAISLHPQLKLHQGATEPKELPTLDAVVKGLVTSGADGMRIDGPGIFATKLTAPPKTAARNGAR